MNLTNQQKWVVFQAIEDKIFKQYHHISDLKKLEQTKEMQYHISNLENDQVLLTEVRNKLQCQIAQYK